MNRPINATIKLGDYIVGEARLIKDVRNGLARDFPDLWKPISEKKES
jgi:ribosomal protein L30E